VSKKDNNKPSHHADRSGVDCPCRGGRSSLAVSRGRAVPATASTSMLLTQAIGRVTLDSSVTDLPVHYLRTKNVLINMPRLA